VCETYIGKPFGTRVVPLVHHRGGKATDTIEPYSNQQPLTRFTRGDDHVQAQKICRYPAGAERTATVAALAHVHLHCCLPLVPVWQLG
jgi:hypothetical protein